MNDHIKSEILKSKQVKELLVDNIMMLDNSTFTNWSGCFVKGMFAGTLKRSPVRGQAPLVFGGAVHEGLEHFHKGMSMDDALDKALEFANPTETDEEGNIIKQGATLNEVADEKRNIDRLRELLIMYELDYSQRMDKFNVQPDTDGTPMVEKSFRLPLGSFTAYLPEIDSEGRLVNWKERTIQLMWEGKIDLIDCDDNGELWVVDHKTTSVMGKQFADDLMRSSQMLGYCWAVKQMTKTLGKPVKGVKINAIALRKNGFDFERFPISLSEWAIDEWWTETLFACEDIAVKLIEFLDTGRAVPSRISCVSKYGKCPFFDCCQTSPIVRSQFLFDDDYYYTSDWSPLN